MTRKINPPRNTTRRKTAPESLVAANTIHFMRKVKILVKKIGMQSINVENFSKTTIHFIITLELKVFFLSTLCVLNILTFLTTCLYYATVMPTQNLSVLMNSTRILLEKAPKTLSAICRKKRQLFHKTKIHPQKAPLFSKIFPNLTLLMRRKANCLKMLKSNLRKS